MTDDKDTEEGVTFIIDFSYPANWYFEQEGLDSALWRVCETIPCGLDTGLGFGFRDVTIHGSKTDLETILPLLKEVFTSRELQIPEDAIEVNLDPMTTLLNKLSLYGIELEEFETVFRTADMDKCRDYQVAHEVPNEPWIEMCAWSMVLSGETLYMGNGYFALAPSAN